MKIIVASQNPVKIEATRAVFARFTTQAIISSQVVESGIPAQPWGDEQTRQGAINRAKAAMISDAAYAIGFEGGLVQSDMGVMTCAWCAVLGASGQLGVGGGAYVLLPPKVSDMVLSGQELGPALDALTRKKNIKQGPGAIGILTNGLSDREEAYAQILIYALAPFRRRDLYTTIICEA